MESTGPIDGLELRIARLERRNRWTTALCALLAVLALAGFTRGQGQVVRAEKFELVNARGATVSQWALERSGPVLQLGHRLEPHVRVGLSNPGGPGLQVAGEHGRGRIHLELLPDVNGTALLMVGPEPVESGAVSGITLLHTPSLGPSILLQERNRRVFRVPAQGP
ncbi:MAG: hypothetical protein KY467_07525 [Gemmatimonadetes bacterium]|nr:hypothetical protein [Gemmatimonadota bacterium]